MNIFQAPEFHLIKDEDYKHLLEESISKAKSEIDEIANNITTPTFANTIEALEFSGRDFNRIASIFYNLNHAHTSKTIQKTGQEIAPLVNEYSMYSLLNERLFERIKYVYNHSTELDKEQKRLLDKTYESFTLNGAMLPSKDKKRFTEISEELSILSLQFSQNLLAANNDFTLHLTEEADLAGLPDYVREMGAAEAKARQLEGMVFTLHNHSFSAFIQYSECRDLREKIWREYNTRCNGGERDNNQIIRKIISLKEQKAKLLGYNTYSEYALVERMAKTPARVNDFLYELMKYSYPAAQKDLQKIRDYANSLGNEGDIYPWDFPYYSEKYKTKHFSINDGLLKPYFELSSVKKAVFNLSNTLYGLRFIENTALPKYQEDVEVYEVYDNNNRFISLLYLDFFPRATKSGGAWMTTYREQGVYQGKEERPFVSVVCNFSKATDTTPSLLTFSEVTTLLHEFGHALHGMLAEGKYPSLTGTNVARDFVELPSQIFENWAYEKEFLESFAYHYQTGELIPEELIEKIIAAKNFNAGYASVRQLRFGIMDMAWHERYPKGEFSVIDFESEVLKDFNILPEIEGIGFSPSFAHIFAGGYSAGYYSYKWAEVLEADAFSLFKEKGIFNKEVAESFRKEILSKGSIEDEDLLFKNFRGRDPLTAPLLKKTGLI